MATMDEHKLPHPHILTESGRATVAYYSVLLFNVMDVSRLENRPVPDALEDDAPEAVHNLLEVYTSLSLKNLQECYNDAIYYRDQIRQLFRLGQCTLRQRALSDTIFWAVIRSIAEKTPELKNPPSALKNVDLALTVPFRHGNPQVIFMETVREAASGEGVCSRMIGDQRHGGLVRVSVHPARRGEGNIHWHEGSQLLC